MSASAHSKDKVNVLDVIMLALGLGFFVVALGYVLACDRL
jgi:hypothetical protein